MEYRAIRREEMPAVNDIMSIAFLFARPEGEQRAQGEREHLYARAAFSDDGRMEACLVVPAYRAMLDGRMVDMQGVGGVSSLPESRRKGHIRGLFDLILREAYEKQQLMSILYPFSFSFYRRFGYELASARRVCRIPIAQLKQFPCRGTTTQYFPGQDTAEIRAVYRSFIQDRNLAIDRDDSSQSEPLWKRWLQNDPYSKRVYTYVWHDETGKARAYAILTPKEIDDENCFLVSDCAYDSPEALRGLLGFLYTTGGQVNALSWRVPDGLRVHTLVPDPYSLKVSEEARGMARVVRPLDALTFLRPPEGKGAYSVALHDEQLPENCGVYKVTFEEGESEVVRVQTAPDVTLSVPALSQLIVGALSFDEMLYGRSDYQLHDNLDTLRRAFTRRNVHLEESF